MPLNKQHGNMYDWVTHTWNPVAGECPHHCSYCYVDDMKVRPVIRDKYSGELRLVEHELKTNLGSGKRIFVGSMQDMWADQVSDAVIKAVLGHCAKYPDNQYLFQSKNPIRMINLASYIPKGSIVGTTIESDFSRIRSISLAPNVNMRSFAIRQLKNEQWDPLETMITLEPLVDFTPHYLINLIHYARPDWVNIGADSKNHGLPEPPWEKVQELITELEKFTIVKCKANLERLRRAA